MHATMHAKRIEMMEDHDEVDDEHNELSTSNASAR